MVDRSVDIGRSQNGVFTNNMIVRESGIVEAPDCAGRNPSASDYESVVYNVPMSLNSSELVLRALFEFLCFLGQVFDDASQSQVCVLPAQHVAYGFRFRLTKVHPFSGDIESEFGPGSFSIFAERLCDFSEFLKRYAILLTKDGDNSQTSYVTKGINAAEWRAPILESKLRTEKTCIVPIVKHPVG